MPFLHLRRRAEHRRFDPRRRFAPTGARVSAGKLLGRCGPALHARRLHRPRNAADSVTLAHRVESMLYRSPAIPKGRLSIAVDHGAVILRGAVDSEHEIAEIESSVRRVPGVGEVENLLHLNGTIAPNKLA